MGDKRAGLYAALVATALSLAAGFAAYQQLFSTFAAYDDEGYLMISLSSVQQGQALYDQVYSQYGPAYYALQSLLLRVTGLPIAHDASRWRTLALWLGSCLLASRALWRQTNCPWTALIGFVILFCHVDRLALEPGHPQEFSLLLLSACWWLIAGMPSATRRNAFRWRAAICGAATGTLLMIKPNLGVFLLVPTGLALLPFERTGWLRHVLVGVSRAAWLALPWVVCHGRLADTAAVPLALLVWGAMMLIVAADAGAQGTREIVPGAAWLYALTTILSATSYGAWAVATGTSWSGLLQGLIGQHVSFGSRAFFHPAPLPWGSSLIVGAGALLLWWSRYRPGIAVGARWGAVVALLLVLARQLRDGGTPLLHGVFDRGHCGLAVALLAPSAWCLLRPPRGSGPDRQPAGATAGLARRWLALAGVTQLLGAYPVPGTQMAVGSFLLVGAGLVVSRDAIRASWSLPFAWRLPNPRWLAATAVTLAAAVLFARDAQTWQRRAAYEPLRLPGTSGLRLPAETVAEMHWLCTQIQDSADTFLFREHSRNSYYFWTRQSPPSSLNATCWPYLLSAAEQQRILAALGSRRRILVITEPYLAPLPVTESPLLRYIDRHWLPVASGAHFRVALLAPGVPGQDQTSAGSAHGARTLAQISHQSRPAALLRQVPARRSLRAAIPVRRLWVAGPDR